MRCPLVGCAVDGDTDPDPEAEPVPALHPQFHYADDVTEIDLHGHPR